MKAKSTLQSAIVISAFLVQISFAALPRYEIIDLGTLGGDRSSASFINDRRQIVGSAYNQQGNRRATSFDSTGSGNNIDLGGINSWACSVNHSGQIVGSADNKQSDLRATLFDTTGSGENIELGTLGGRLSWAQAINDSGQIVGAARNEQGYQRATLFDSSGSGYNIDLGTLGGIHSQACSINDRGQIVGNARIQRGYSHATLFDPTGGGNNIDLGTLGGSSSNACSINNLGQIVGWAANDWLDNRACLFDPTGGGKNIELGTLGGRLSWAEAINDAGQIVGAAENQLRDTRATLFDPTGSGNNIDLNTLIDPAYGWTLKYTDSINNHGWIVGTGVNPAGHDHAYLLIPKPAIIYVNDDATGNNDGSSWADAFNYIQDALAAAWSGDEIRVAQGLYKPDQGAGITAGDREATFQLTNGVVLKGGYAGFGEPDPNAYDIELYETILSGDLYGDDGSDFANNGENSYHVVTGTGTDETAVLDGFTITAGNANGSNPYNSGGGMYNNNSSTTLTNCTFAGNLAKYGGGMYNNQSTLTLTNCAFTENSAIWAPIEAGKGGAMYNNHSSPMLTNCTFIGNSADSGGGGIYNYISSPILNNCTFSANLAEFEGIIPAIYYYPSRLGGGMYNDQSSPTLTNCKFGANSAVGGGAIYITGEFQGTLTDCVFENNTTTLGGGAIYCTGTGELNIIRCKFSNGTANRGGVIYNGHASLILSECILEGNQAKYAGAISTGGDITLTNCLLANNQALVYGGALDNMGSTSRSVNCTFVGNSSNYGGAIFSNIECDTIAINCIFWNNTAQTGSQIATSGSHGGSTLTVNYCDIENLLDGLYVPSGCTLNWGEDNINAEPLFADSDNGDYRLSASSPCVDVGDPNYVPEPNETDLDGKPRVIGGRIDMGAYETPVPAEVRIVPRTINLTSMGKWITSYIWLPEDYDVADIEPNSIFLEDEIQPEELLVNKQEQVATAQFIREDVQDILTVGEIGLTITGRLTDGTVFEGTDVIRVINKAGGKSAK